MAGSASSLSIPTTHAVVLSPLLKALVVIGRADLREIVRDMLTALGCEAVIAQNAREALSYCELTAPHLIICSAHFDDSSGAELTRRIRASPNLQRTKIAALTGFGLGLADAARFDFVLTTPLSLACLTRLIDLCAAASGSSEHSTVAKKR